jgi:hypothetical protein
MLVIQGGVWTPASVQEIPEVFLSNWAVFDVSIGSGDLTRHFVGTNVAEVQGRVSSPLIKFDPLTRRGVTRSGRVYELVGLPTRLSADASYTWEHWLKLNRIYAEIDVTSSIAILLKEEN